MEDKNRQNPIQTAEIFAAADARDGAETSSSVHANAPADPLKKPIQPILALFGSTIGAPETKPKRRSLGRKRRESNERQIAKNTTSGLRYARYAHDLEPLSASKREPITSVSLLQRNRTTGAAINKAIANGRADSPSSGGCKVVLVPNTFAD